MNAYCFMVSCKVLHTYSLYRKIGLFVQPAPKNMDGRVLMYFAEAYRENCKPRQRKVERIGFVSCKNRIGSHFLTCFISLLIVRILEHELHHEYFTEQIVLSLNKANVVQLDSTNCKTLSYDPVLRDLYRKMGIDFGLNIYSRLALRSMLTVTKKQG